MQDADIKLLVISNLVGKLSDEEVKKPSLRKSRVAAAIQTYNLIVSELESKE